jgi:cytoskeletal protein CcmA (bactofilin family)
MGTFFNRRNPDPGPTSTPAPQAASTPRPVRPEPTPPAANVPTRIAHGSKVVGDVTGTTDLTIEGLLEGQIQVESRVVVGSKGEVRGKILANSVLISGKVIGNVTGKERVEVQAAGALEGDVLSPKVVIAEGAFFKGKIEMAEVPDKAAKNRSASAESVPPRRPEPETPAKGKEAK